MRRSPIHRILLLVAFAHLFADVALATGAVLCVGPDGHTAIEIGHLAPGCESFEDGTRPGIDVASVPESCTGCTDSPLHAEAEVVAKRFFWAFDLLRPLAHPVAMPAPTTGTLRFVQAPLALSKLIRAHRTTVLLI